VQFAIVRVQKNESHIQPSSIITTAEKKSQAYMAKKQKIVPISEGPENKEKISPNYPFQNRGGLCIWG
jgi:hypothetical protein